MAAYVHIRSNGTLIVNNSKGGTKKPPQITATVPNSLVEWMWQLGSS